jgi:RNA recognition motif-containing protein
MPILSPETNDSAVTRRVLPASKGASLEKRILYVGGLGETVSDSELRDLFGKYGAVARAYIIRHKHSGKSAGYGFVEMSSGEQARTAAVALEGTAFAGHSLRLYVTSHVAQNSQPQPPIPQELS